MQNGLTVEEKLGNRIAGFRDSKRLTQSDISKKLGISRSAYAQIEQGKITSEPNNRKKLLIEIGQILGIGSILLSEQPFQDESKVQDLISEFSLLAHRNYFLAQGFLRTARQAEEASEDGDKLLLEIANDKWEEVRLLYPGAVLGTIDFKEQSSIEIWGKLLEGADTKVLATSCLKPSAWWSSPVGSLYQDLNIRRMKQQSELKTERIFVFSSPEECIQAKEIISRQIEAKIDIWVGGVSQKFPPGLGSDFYVIDNRYVGWLYVRDREVIEGTKFSTNLSEISRAKKLFESMKSYCSPISNLAQLEQLCSRQ